MNDLPPKMSMDIASPPDREKLVAEIFYEDQQWAEIHQETGALTLEFKHAFTWLGRIVFEP